MAQKQLVLFKVAGETFGIDISLVKEIVPYQDITPVPDSYDFVEGIVNLRGKIVTVIDMRRRLRATSANREKTTRIIILDFEGKLMGIIVDTASEIVRIDTNIIGPPPELLTEVGSGYIMGIVKQKDRLIVLLDLRRILSAEEVSRLDELVAVLYGEKL